MIPYQAIHTELTKMAASQAAISVSGTLPKLTPAQMAALASGLGRKNGVKVIFDNHSTASTDGNVIIMPLTSRENSWICRGYLDHELGHVRFTDLDLIPKSTPFERSLWNIIEDIRIEKALGDTYPGMATNLSTLVSELRRTKAGVFEVQPDSPPEAVICGYVGLTLRTLYLKQHMLADLALKTRDQFLNTFSPELERDLFEIITQIGSVSDTAGVVAMVKEIVALLEKHRDAVDTSESDSKDEHEEKQPSSEDQDAPGSPGQSQQGPDQPDNPSQSQTDPADQDDQDNLDDPDNAESSVQIPDNPDDRDSPVKGMDTSNDQGSPEKSQDDPGSSQSIQDDPDQLEQSPTEQVQHEQSPASSNPPDQSSPPLDSEGEQSDADLPVHSSPDPADNDDHAADSETGEEADQSEAEVSDTESVGVGSGTQTDQPQPQTDSTPLQAAITQALESQEEIGDFGQQLKEMALKSEVLSGNNPRAFGIAEATPQSQLQSCGYLPQQITASSGVVAKLSANLKGLLQAQGLARIRPSAAGTRIARSRLHRIRTGESKLFLRNSTQKQVNTAVHLLLDISGSMNTRRMAVAKDVVFALVKALANQRGINLALTLFPAFYPYNANPSKDHAVYPVAPLIAHGQRPTSTLPWPTSNYGCTPLAESLRYVLSAMVPLTESRKLVVLITDGEPNDSRTTKTALDEAETLGIEVATLGIEGLAYADLFPICEVVNRVEDLPQKAFKLLESLLTPNKE
ncbi:vWA domain-containing protein [Desulfonatronum parangueonense]